MIQKDLLKKERDKVKKYLDIAAVIIIIVDASGKVNLINKKGCEVLGYEEKDIVGKNWFDNFLPERVRDEARGRVANLMAGRLEPCLDIQNFVLTRNKEERLISWNNAVIHDEEGRIVGWLSSGEDITEKKKIEEELRLKAELLDNIYDAIIVVDEDMNIIYANEANCKQLGYTQQELLQMNLNDIIVPAPASSIAEANKELLTRGFAALEHKVRRKDRSLLNVEVNSRRTSIGGMTYVISIARDITERKKMLESMMISDRLASLGEMALAVSHELNNPLTSIIGFSQMVLEDENIKGQNRDDLEKINSQAQRAAEIIRNFITFARGQPTEKVLVNLNNIITSVIDLRQYELKSKNITVTMRLADDLSFVLADQAQIQHVVMNVVINAEYFLAGLNGGGNLTITTENSNNSIRASFIDDGPGLKKEVMSHIFDPFFTRKGLGKGIGLGLSVCYGIMTQHEGNIYADSEEGRGTTITIELPVVKE